MKGRDVTKVYYKKKTKQKSKIRYVQTVINPGTKISMVVSEMKTFMMEFDSQCKFSRKGALRKQIVCKDSERMDATH